MYTNSDKLYTVPGPFPFVIHMKSSNIWLFAKTQKNTIRNLHFVDSFCQLAEGVNYYNFTSVCVLTIRCWFNIVSHKKKPYNTWSKSTTILFHIIYIYISLELANMVVAVLSNYRLDVACVAYQMKIHLDMFRLVLP